MNFPTCVSFSAFSLRGLLFGDQRISGKPSCLMAPSLTESQMILILEFSNIKKTLIIMLHILTLFV